MLHHPIFLKKIRVALESRDSHWYRQPLLICLTHVELGIGIVKLQIIKKRKEKKKKKKESLNFNCLNEI